MSIIYSLNTVSVPSFGTFGSLKHPTGALLCRTVEREWLNNAKGVSCIPAGDYTLVLVNSPKFGEDSIALTNVSLGVSVNGPTQRSEILIHTGNKQSDLRGCIAPGLQFGPDWSVAGSRVALQKLRNEIVPLLKRGDTVILRIKREFL